MWLLVFEFKFSNSLAYLRNLLKRNVVEFPNQYTENCVQIMFVNFQLKKMAMIILLFLIEVGIKVVIITSGICYFGIMEIRKVYRSESLVKERAD